MVPFPLPAFSGEACLTSNIAFRTSRPRAMGNANTAPPGTKYNKPVNAERVSIIPPTMSPRMNLETAKPIDIILPIKGTLFNNFKAGVKNFNIFAMSPPLNIEPILSIPFCFIVFRPFTKPSPKIPVIVVRIILPILTNLPIVVAKIFLIMANPVFANIFNVPFQGPSVNKPPKSAAIEPIKSHHFLSSFFKPELSPVCPFSDIILGVILCTDVLSAVSLVYFF